MVKCAAQEVVGRIEGDHCDTLLTQRKSGKTYILPFEKRKQQLLQNRSKRRMRALIDATVKFRQQYTMRNPASIDTICDHLANVYDAVQHDNCEHNKSYSGIRVRVMSNTISLLLEVYSSYLLNAQILDSEFFILVYDIIARAFNETRHELVSDDEKQLLQPVCDIILKIAESMTPELANCKMIPLFFDRAFVLSMADGLKTSTGEHF